MEKDPNRFYVYEIYDIDTNEVIYVGKGTGQRRYSRSNHRSDEFIKSIHRRNVKSRIVEDSLTNEDALSKEIEQIKKRKEEGHPLCNKTEGGQGFTSSPNNPAYTLDWFGENNPFFGKHHTSETKAIMSERRKGKGARYGKDNPMYGKGFKGEDNPMYGMCGFKHPNHKKILVKYPDSSEELMTSKQAELKFGIAYERIRHTGGVLHYKTHNKNFVYEGAQIIIVEPVTTIEKDAELSA